MVREYYDYPKLNTGTRPEEEHRAAQTPSEWKDGEQSDNLDSKKS